MPCTEASCQWFIRDADWWAFEFAGRDGIEAGTWWFALKGDEKDAEEGVDDQGSEEGVMRNDPSGGGEAGQAHVEHGDGHFDDGHGYVEDHLLNGRKL